MDTRRSRPRPILSVIPPMASRPFSCPRSHRCTRARFLQKVYWPTVGSLRFQQWEGEWSIRSPEAENASEPVPAAGQSHQMSLVITYSAESQRGAPWVQKKNIRLGTGTWTCTLGRQEGPGLTSPIDSVCSTRSLQRESSVFEPNPTSNLCTLVVPGWRQGYFLIPWVCPVIS